MEIQAAGNRRLLSMVQQWIYRKLLKPLALFYLRFEVKYRYDGFTLRVFPGVFHPGFYFSTRYLYNFLKKLPLQNKRFLELGCGAGLISMLAHRAGALVTAVDLDPLAIKNTQINFTANFKNADSATVLQSDLFQNLGNQKFDTITINPPYFFKKVEVNRQLAWYCGENGEYFQRLFAGLPNHTLPDAQVWIVLADNCDFARINAIAATAGFVLVKADERKIKWEMNYIYEVKPA